MTRSADGTTIAYTVQGEGDAIPIVLCAGFMCPDNFWRGIAPLLFPRHRVVILNYRSVGASGHPRPPGYRARNLSGSDYTIERFAEDVIAVLDAEGIERAIPVGHSMGVQVALELHHQLGSQRIPGLVLVTGPYASPLKSFYGSNWSYLFPLVRLGVPLLPRNLSKRIPKLIKLPFAMPVARTVRALGPHTPDEGMDLYFEHFANGDPAVILRIADGMHRFDASPWLAEVDVPTLVVVGDRDTFSPPELGEDLVERLPNAELVTVHDGTHAAIIEFPVEIHDAVADWLERHFEIPAEEPAGDPRRTTWRRRTT